MHARLEHLDYSLLQTAPESFAQDLFAATHRDGFVLLANHPIKHAIRSYAFAASHQFFALPLDRKNSININFSNNHRGYFAEGEEHLDKQYPKADRKEGIKIGRDLAADHPLVLAGIPLHGSNQWPQLAGFRDQMQTLFAACLDTSRQLMRAFALALKLPEDYFETMTDQPMATLTPLHYPRCAKTGASLGAGAHSDFGCLSLVIQDGTNGLEIWNQQYQQWQQVSAHPDLLVVNVGDMLQRWTSDLLPSVRHRVNNRDDRYSFAFFFDPNYDTLITPLAAGFNNHRPVTYPPITALKYLQQRIADSFNYFEQVQTSRTESQA